MTEASGVEGKWITCRSLSAHCRAGSLFSPLSRVYSDSPCCFIQQYSPYISMFFSSSDKYLHEIANNQHVR